MEIKFEKKTARNLVLVLALLVVGYIWLKEPDKLQSVYDKTFGLFTPFFVGAAIAFVLNVPMRFIERKLSFIKNEIALRITAICLTLLALLAVIAVVLVVMIPQIRDALRLFLMQLPGFFEKIDVFLLNLTERFPQIGNFIGQNGGEGIDWAKLLDTIMAAFQTSSSTLLGNVVGLLTDLVNGVYNAIFSVIFAFYCLARKETLARQFRKLLYSTAKEKWADEVIRVARMSNTVFSNFITGQCLDAVILGLMCAIVMAIMRMPYIPLICILIVVTALVPVVGALIGCAVGAFLIFVSSPLQALLFVLMFIIVQQIDNNIVYPRVVGSSIGLPGMWVLVAVSVGGELMGAAGMLIMVPFASVLYALLRDFSGRRLAKKQIAQEKLRCQPPELQTHFMFKRSVARKQAKKAKKDAASAETPQE